MRAADRLTISVPAAMAEQMNQAQKTENRTRSELLHEAWREYFESHYGSYAPAKAELAAIRRGRAEIARGEYRTLEEILGDLDSSRRKRSRKTTRKGSR